MNEDLRESIVDWLNWLKNDIGFDSWRFDFVKGYGGQFMEEYVGKTVGQEKFNVGEYWADLRYVMPMECGSDTTAGLAEAFGSTSHLCASPLPLRALQCHV